MRHALIENGVVANTIVVGPEPYTPPPGHTLVASETAAIGDTWDGQSFSAPSRPLAEVKAAASAAVMTKREAVINGGVTFNSTRFQTRPSDRENVSGASLLAFMAVSGGAQPGNLLWHGGAADFAWIAEDNSLVTMDAQTVIAFGQAVANHKSACIFHSRDLKDQIEAAATAEAVAAIDINAGWPA